MRNLVDSDVIHRLFELGSEVKNTSKILAKIRYVHFKGASASIGQDELPVVEKPSQCLLQDPLHE